MPTLIQTGYVFEKYYFPDNSYQQHIAYLQPLFQISGNMKNKIS
jgi:hypothetical protein